MPGELPSLVPRWGRRGELREIGQAKHLFNLADLFDGILIAVLAELLVLDVLEPLAHVAKLALRERRLPGWENDGVFAGGMVLIHPHECLECTCKGIDIASFDPAFAG